MFFLFAPNLTIFVSLFTREWIEIERLDEIVEHAKVSLFTREWIEIYNA